MNQLKVEQSVLSKKALIENNGRSNDQNEP